MEISRYIGMILVACMLSLVLPLSTWASSPTEESASPEASGSNREITQGEEQRNTGMTFSQFLTYITLLLTCEGQDSNNQGPGQVINDRLKPKRTERKIFIPRHDTRYRNKNSYNGKKGHR